MQTPNARSHEFISGLPIAQRRSRVDIKDASVQVKELNTNRRSFQELPEYILPNGSHNRLWSAQTHGELRLSGKTAMSL
jgi:hypothetical protein